MRVINLIKVIRGGRVISVIRVIKVIGVNRVITDVGHLSSLSPIARSLRVAYPSGEETWWTMMMFSSWDAWYRTRVSIELRSVSAMSLVSRGWLLVVSWIMLWMLLTVLTDMLVMVSKRVCLIWVIVLVPL